MAVLGRLEASDLAVLGGYLLILLVVGGWSSCANRGSTSGYFLAGRSVHFILAGASLFAANIGSGHFIGLAGTGASNGIIGASYEFNAIFVLMLLGWVFVPVYVSAGVYTMPEYLKLRFGGRRIQMYLSFLALLLSIFTKISADLFAGAIFIEQAAGLNLWTAVIILILISAIFTILGGLTAVIWTDFAQTIIMVVGAAVLMVRAFIAAGGFGEIYKKYPNARPSITEVYDIITNNSITSLIPSPTLESQTALNRTLKYGKCGNTNPLAFHLFRPLDDPEFPWTGVVFGITISSIWYWCSDQVIVQRVLATKNLMHGKLGCIVAGYLKALPIFLIIFPGMVARILYPNEVGCVDPEVCMNVCGKRTGCGDIAYPTLLLRLLPQGLRGLLLAVAISALVSSLSSVFNSSSTIFTMDFWRFVRKNAGQMELMIVSRMFVVFLVGVSVAWIPIVQSGGELFGYIQRVTSFLSPPVCAVFLMAILWPRCNEQGAFWSLIIGLIVGMVRFITELFFENVPCGEEERDNRPGFIKDFVFLNFGIALWLLTLFCCAVISLLTRPIPENCLHRLTFWTRFSTEERTDIDSLPNAPSCFTYLCTRKQETPEPETSSNVETRQVEVQPSKSMSPQPPNSMEELSGAKTGKENAAFLDSEKKDASEVHAQAIPLQVLGVGQNEGVVAGGTVILSNGNGTSGSVPTAPPAPNRLNLPWWKRAVFFICGIEEDMLDNKKSEEVETIPELLALIKETPLQKHISWTNFAILISVAIGFWAFFR